jgi:hypothetical protein
MINIIPNFEQLHSLNKLIETKSSFNIGFMYRNLDQVDVAKSNDFTWRVGTRAASEKPRYIIIGFQTNRSKNNNNPARFDNCNVRTIYVELNDYYIRPLSAVTFESKIFHYFSKKLRFLIN